MCWQSKLDDEVLFLIISTCLISNSHSVQKREAFSALGNASLFFRINSREAIDMLRVMLLSYL